MVCAKMDEGKNGTRGTCNSWIDSRLATIRIVSLAGRYCVAMNVSRCKLSLTRESFDTMIQRATLSIPDIPGCLGRFLGARSLGRRTDRHSRERNPLAFERHHAMSHTRADWRFFY
jgi:hypothetical protein